MEFERVMMHELDEVMHLYESVKDHNMAGWNDKYPDLAFIQRDIQRKQLYCLKDAGKIIACIAWAKDGEFDEVSLLNDSYKPTVELSRLVVDRKYQNRGIALQLIQYLLDMLKQKGYTSVHYLVTKGNIPALKSYAHLNFDFLGEEDMFDMHFLVYAKML